MEPFLKIEHDGAVVTATLNRPEQRNTLTEPSYIREFVDLCANLTRDPHVKVLILTGAGPAFCAGGNVKDMRDRTGIFGGAPAELRESYRSGIQTIPTALYNLDIPVIAAVNGPAIAGGMSLATIPDFTLATPESKFGFNEVRVGFVPAIAASFLLRQVGEKRSRELLLTGRLLKAQEALCLGLVTQVVATEELMQTAHALAQTLLQNSPQAMQAVKRLLAKHARRRLDEEIEDAIEVNALQRSTEDFKEGVQAFLQHRKPEWPSLKGRG